MARVLTYYSAPLTGVTLSGAPDESYVEIPDCDYQTDDVVEHEGRRLQVISRRRKGGKLVGVVCRETVPHVPMAVANAG